MTITMFIPTEFRPPKEGEWWVTKDARTLTQAFYTHNEPQQVGTLQNIEVPAGVESLEIGYWDVGFWNNILVDGHTRIPLSRPKRKVKKTGWMNVYLSSGTTFLAGRVWLDKRSALEHATPYGESTRVDTVEISYEVEE